MDDRARAIGLVMMIVLLVHAEAGSALEPYPTPGASVTGAQTGSNQPDSGVKGSKPMGVGEMRQWLNQRNQERKERGLAGPSAYKNHIAAIHPRLRKEPERTFGRYPSGGAEAHRGEPILHIGQGPDGRIHHRYIIKEEGPDEFQVYSGMGYNPVKPETLAQKWARLTPRGRQLWFGGSTLRRPESRTPHYRRERTVTLNPSYSLEAPK